MEGHKKLLISATDFANIFKAFIGTQYMTLSFGFNESGIILGIFGLVLVALATTHCCHLLVKVKYHTMNHIKEQIELKFDDKDGSDDAQLAMIEQVTKEMESRLTYADIGRILYGRKGAFIVTLCLFITQCGFCVAYHIFIGIVLITIINAYTSEVNEIPSNQTAILNSSLTNIASTPIPNPVVDSLFITPENSTWTLAISEQALLVILIVIPVPIFMLFSLFRTVRNIGPYSFMANIVVFLGYFVILFTILDGFSVSSTVAFARWKTFPIIIVQGAAAYEAIGTILSIEASYEENRSSFASHLYGAVTLVTVLFTILAAIGYLRYGNDTAQIILQNLPQNNLAVLLIEITALIGVIFTYPIQIYPVTHLLEVFFFTDAYINWNPDGNGNSVSSTPDTSLVDFESSQTQSLVKNKPDLMEILGIKATYIVSEDVAPWKRNCLRIGLAILIALTAIVFRNILALAAALVGALGSSPLAFIFPCWFHIKLKYATMSRGVLFKDIAIIVICLGFILLGVIVAIGLIIQLA